MAAFSSLVGEVRALARALKERSRSGMLPTLIATRAGHPVALAMHGEMRELLAVAGTMAGGYGADSISLVTDSVIPQVPENPLTGQAWSNGDATDALAHRGAEEGWVAECQVVMLATRSGRESVSTQPFRVLEGALVWSSDLDNSPDLGFLPTLVRAFKADLLDPSQVSPPGAAHRTAMGQERLSPQQGRISLDVSLTRMLDARFTLERPGGGAMLIARDDEQTMQLRAAGLTAGQFLLYHAG